MRIQRLPPALANQIAAGEVVERPASVVKELVENAIDAGASRVTVTVALGGKQLIRVEDDGAGMVPADARLALERHATSKIARAEDLAAIGTLGFRGEALPSIASVSHLTLRTRARGTDAGTEVRVDGGALAAVREIGAPEGTSVQVADLFYNLPARRKFLKSDAAEAAQISRVVTQLAMAYPEIGFALISGDRTVMQCPPARDLEARFFQLYGDRPHLLEVRRDTAGIRIWGLAAPLTDTAPARGVQNVFVNRRIVRDRTITHAVSSAYGSATVKGRTPEVHLFIDLPPDRVDVNVHPTKAEVRFLEQSLVHEVIRRAMADALGQTPAPDLRLQAPIERPPEPLPRPIPGVFAGGPPADSRWAPLAEAFSRPDAPAVATEPATRPAAAPGGPAPLDVAPMVPLGQFRDTYIVAIDQDGIAIVDQHVAHERVLFEQILEKLSGGRLETQRLLEPVVLELPPAQRQVLGRRAEELRRAGFEVEEFGGQSIRLAGVPALLNWRDAEAALTAVSLDLEDIGSGAPADEALRRIAASMACHAAVKANAPLALDKMQYILDELRRTAYSSVCPHGRPVVLRLTRREIEKNFQRI